MARTGRPPKPVEQHRKTGTFRPDRHVKDVGEVVALRPADGVPTPPVELLTDGAALWSKVWSAGAVWIAPATDMEAVAELCRLADDVSIARERYRATRDPSDLRAVATVSKLLQESLSSIGFNPTARSRLGVAEVKAQNKLEELRERRQKNEATR